ncbi:MAG: hypothetical protein JYX80_05800 [Candidatus Scalindua sediminis]|nr:hypothetical protein [Candidatus Scalindua sediminis]
MAFTLFSRIVSKVMDEINEWSEAKKPYWSFASTCVTLASSMIASALKDDLYPKSGKKRKLIGYSIKHKKLQNITKLLRWYNVS